ncbi:hypothetical protein ACXR2U_22655 [Jatrophihabitans sp. YIM 134969]
MRRPVRTAAVVASTLAVVVAALVAPATARADDTCTISWTGGTGNWSDPTRWSPARVPTTEDAVCVVRAAGASPVAVRVRTSTEVQRLTLRGGTLSLPGGSYFDVHDVVAARAALTGGGAVRGSVGIVDLTDTALRGVHLSTSGGLRLSRGVTFTGGSTVDASGFTDLRPGVRVVDGDGNAANHVQVSGFTLYLSGSVFVGVALNLRNASVFCRGDLVLARLDNLTSDGVLDGGSDSTVQLDSSVTGSITLPRTITAIGKKARVFAGGLRTPEGADALRDLRRVDGTLGLDRTLTTGAITVRGSVVTSQPLSVPILTVRSGGFLSTQRVLGTLVCGGSCSIPGARLERLTVQAGATVYTDATEPVTVTTDAQLDGTLAVSLPFGQPPAGTKVVLLTAAGGVRGTFATVRADRNSRTVTPAYRPTFVTGTIGNAA